MKRIFLVLAVLAAGLLARPAFAQDPALDTSEPTLLPGDGIKITVFRRDELSGSFRVNGDSTIAHPLYKELKVAALPMTTVNARITAFLARYEANPQVLIEPLFRVVVAGEVNAPDMYEFGTGITVARAISLAGGVTQSGNIARVRLIRDGRRTAINLKAANPRYAGMTVRSGDQIIVLKRLNYVTDVILPAGGIVLALNQLWVGIKTIFDKD